MRELSANIGINEETFEPILILLLDNIKTGTTITTEAIADMRMFHDDAVEQSIIDMTVNSINNTHNLTEEEIEHYTTNFKSLVTGLVIPANVKE